MARNTARSAIRRGGIHNRRRSWRPRRTLATVLAAGALVLAACDGGSGPSEGSGGGDPQQGGILRTAISDTAPTETLDPHVARSAAQNYLMGMLFNTLVNVADDGTVSPSLAETWTLSDDAKSWTFKLRTDVTFHDGTPMKAKDVAWSYKRILDDSIAASFHARLSASLDPSGIVVVDDHTLTLNMKRPDALLIQSLGDRGAMIVKDQQNEFTAENAVGTGPFKLKSFTPGESFEVVRNDDYFRKGMPYLDGVQNSHIDSASLRDALVSGTIDWTDGIPIKAAAQLKDDDRIRIPGLADDPALKRIYFLHMNLNAKPFTDPRVVKALKLALDRDAIRAAVLGDVSPAVISGDVPVPKSEDIYPKSVTNDTQNIAEAKKLLKEAGYPDGIDLVLPTAEIQPGMVDFSVALAETAKEAGFRIKIQQVPADTYFDREFGKAALFHDYAQRRPAYDIMSTFFAKGGGYNGNGFDSDGTLLAQLDAALAETDESARNKMLTDSLAYVAENSGTVIAFFLPDPTVTSSSVHGSQDNRLSFSWDEVWIKK